MCGRINVSDNEGIRVLLGSLGYANMADSRPSL